MDGLVDDGGGGGGDALLIGGVIVASHMVFPTLAIPPFVYWPL